MNLPACSRRGAHWIVSKHVILWWYLRNSRSVALLFMHSCRASEQLIVEGSALSTKVWFKITNSHPISCQRSYPKKGMGWGHNCIRTSLLHFQAVFHKPHDRSRTGKRKNNFVFTEIWQLKQKQPKFRWSSLSFHKVLGGIHRQSFPAMSVSPCT